MKATTKEEAEKAWELFFTKQFGRSHDEQYCAVEYFKSALRAEIENEFERGDELKEGLSHALKLLETTLPPKE